MHVSRLRLTNFRNYRSVDAELPPGLVLLMGENAQGKTNLLEAMFYLSTSRSPRTSRDAELIAWNTPVGEAAVARAEATVQRASGTVTLDITVMARGEPRQTEAADEADVFVAAAPGANKRIRVNGVARRAMDLLGNFPVALFRPEDVDLVAGAPAIRRRSLDILLSQLDPRYPRSLQKYGRAVTQRNHLLRRISERAATADQLGPWDDLLVREGAFLLEQRIAALSKLSAMAEQAHGGLSGERDRLSMAYQPTAVPTDAGLLPDLASIGEAFHAGLARSLPKDIALGQTTVGPHRDDVSLLINGAPAADYASRGQQRTVALSWRLAEAEYLRAASAEPPVVLLDDVLSELDAGRRAAVMSSMSPFQQVFLTTTGSELGSDRLPAAAVFEVMRGELERRG